MFRFENDAQYAIRETLRKFACKEIPPYQCERYYQTLPRELFASLAAHGLTGLTIDEKFGGIGQSALSSSIAMEELAAVDLGPAIFLSVHLMVAGIIQKHGDEAQKSKLLPRLASGELLAAFALTEPGAGSDASSITTTAIKQDGSYILNGEKCYITSAGFADVYLVFARTGDSKKKSEISAFFVTKDTPGLQCGAPEKKMGCELSPIASLVFSNVKVPESQLVGTLHQGFKIALSALAGGRINIAACANGISRAAIAAAVKFTKERSQFGSAIIDFQGVEFMLADMAMSLEAAQLLVWQAASVHEGRSAHEHADSAASMAKCFATDTAMRNTTDAVQLLGGAGYIKEYRVERMMREAKMLQIVEGTNQIQRLVIARGLKK